MKPTMGSLFAGIGGFDLGFERAGFTMLWQVEIDPYCRKVLARHFPEAERFEDVRECGKHNLRPVDVICGGFPCQDISNAGKRAGIDGERSGLWSEFARIIGELRPHFVVVENVAALLGRGIGRVLGDLAEIGYDAEWEVISAADVGAPHLRERVWIVAYPGHQRICERGCDCCDLPQGARLLGNAGHDLSGQPEIQTQVLGDSHDNEAARQREYRGEVYSQPDAIRLSGSSGFISDADKSGLSVRNETGNGSEEVEGIFAGRQFERIHATTRFEQWAVEPDVGRVAHGVPARVDRLRALGNAVVPQIPELIARRLMGVLS